MPCSQLLWYGEKLAISAALLTIPVYILFVCTLLRYRKTDFKSPFFKIALSAGFADISVLLVFYALIMLPSWGWLKGAYVGGGALLGKVAMLVYGWFSRAQTMHVVALAANRYTAILYPFKHKLLWSPRRTFIILSVIYTTALLLGSSIVLTSFEYKPQPNNGSGLNLVSVGGGLPRLLAFAILVLVHLSAALICLPLHAVTGWRLWRHKQQQQQTQSQQNQSAEERRTEIKLAMAAVLISFNEMLLGAYYLTSILFPTATVADSVSHFSRLHVLNVLNSASNPYIHLLLSSRVRSCFVKFVRSLLPASNAVGQAPQHNQQLTNGTAQARTRY